jgi:nucleotide-binding universal stress UspA family protein
MIKILVPVDFSETSKNALQYAVDLFGGTDLEITLLHIYGTQSTALMMKSIDRVLIENAEREMTELIGNLKKDFPDLQLRSRLAKNYAASTISDLGNSGEYDLIVMGTKGVSGLKEVFMGSIAGGVISKTSAPVIVVPLDYKFTSLDRIVFAVGDATTADAELFKPLIWLAQLYNSDLEVLHVSNNGRSHLDLVGAELEELNPHLTHKSGTGDLNQQLNVHIQNNDTDLLCLLRTKKDFLDRLFKGSVTLKQTFNSPVPLLILHN